MNAQVTQGEKENIESNIKNYEEMTVAEDKLFNEIRNSWTIIINNTNTKIIYDFIDRTKGTSTKEIKPLNLTSEEIKTITSCEDLQKYVGRNGIQQYFVYKDDIDNRGLIKYKFNGDSEKYLFDIKEYNQCFMFTPSEDRKEIILKPFY
ncbi:MAG: hypothetical protein ACWA45_04275 [Flavobacteriales bacterium]